MDAETVANLYRTAVEICNFLSRPDKLLLLVGLIAGGVWLFSSLPSEFWDHLSLD